MKLIILDHLRRWWWMWGLCLVAYICFIAILDLGHNDKFFTTFPIGMFMGTFLLSVDMMRGHTRSLVTLPVRLQQVARAWWWVSVGLPAAAIILVTTVEFTLFYGRFDWARFAVICLSNFLTLGASFYALTGLPRGGYDGGWKTRARGYFFGALWGFSFAGWLLVQHMSLTPIAWLGLLTAAFIFTAMGWFRAELLVQERSASLAGEPALRPKNATPSRTAKGHGGLAYLAQSIFLKMAHVGVAMFVAFAIIIPFLNYFVFQSTSAENMGMMFPILTTQFVYVTIFQIIVFGGHIRHLRTMPISATKLAAVLVFTVQVAMLMICYAGRLLLTAFLKVPQPGLEMMIEDGSLFQIAIATTFVPLFVWRPLGILNFMIMMILMISSSILVIIQHKWPVGISMSLAVLTVTSAFFITKTLLERSSRTYRPRTNQFGFWGGGI